MLPVIDALNKKNKAIAPTRTMPMILKMPTLPLNIKILLAFYNMIIVHIYLKSQQSAFGINFIRTIWSVLPSILAFSLTSKLETTKT